MKRVKVRIFAGAVCEQIVYTVPDRISLKKAKPKRPRFQSEEEREAHRDGISRRRNARLINNTFGPTSLYSTLTYDQEYEVHTAEECRKERDNLYRRLIYHYPNAKIYIVYGQGKSTSRFHLHLITDGIPEDQLGKLWGRGSVTYVRHLREHNYYIRDDGTKVDHGRDYTGLANYLFDHWQKSFGGHRWKASRNCTEPEPEQPTLAIRDYSPQRPPIAPKGYKLVEASANQYGFQRYIYVICDNPERRQHRLN